VLKKNFMDSFHASNPKFDFIQVYFKWTQLQEQPHTRRVKTNY